MPAAMRARRIVGRPWTPTRASGPALPLGGDWNGRGDLEVGDAILALKVSAGFIIEGPFYPASVSGAPMGFREALSIVQNLDQMR